MISRPHASILCRQAQLHTTHNMSIVSYITYSYHYIGTYVQANVITIHIFNSVDYGISCIVVYVVVVMAAALLRCGYSLTRTRAVSYFTYSYTEID